MSRGTSSATSQCRRHCCTVRLVLVAAILGIIARRRTGAAPRYASLNFAAAPKSPILSRRLRHGYDFADTACAVDVVAVNRLLALFKSALSTMHEATGI